MKIRNPAYRETVKQLFDAPFLNHLGIELIDCGPGWCHAGLTLQTHHQQQDGYGHAGVATTLADHAAGAAAYTLVGADQIILSIEFKINHIRPIQGSRLTGKAMVLKAGRHVTVVEAEVFDHLDDQEPVLSNKALLTMAVVQRPTEPKA